MKVTRTLSTIILLTIWLLGGLAAPGRAATASSVLPPATIVAGWKRLSTHSYSAANLYQAINGEADAVRRFDFRTMIHGEYAPAASSRPVITVDVFDMGDPLNAYGLFAGSDRGSGSPATVGAEGVSIDGTGLNFWKDRFVVRTTIVGSGAATPQNRAAQNALARAAAARITGSASPPAQLRALPVGYSSGSERYVRSNVIGLAYLKNAVTARYPSAGAGAELFIAQYPSAGQAASAFSQLQQAQKTGSGFTAWKVGDDGFSVNARYMRGMAAARKGRTIVGVVRANSPQSARSLVQKALPRVP